MLVLKQRIALAEAIVTRVPGTVMEEAAIIQNTLVTTADRQFLSNNHIYTFGIEQHLKELYLVLQKEQIWNWYKGCT